MHTNIQKRVYGENQLCWATGLVTTLAVLKSNQTHLFVVINTTGLNKYTNSEAYKIQNKNLKEKHLWQLSTALQIPDAHWRFC